MRHDILFHLVKKEDYKEAEAGGNFAPRSLQKHGSIPCAGGSKIETVANEKFKGEQKILLLVIDVSTVSPEIRYKKEKSGERDPYLSGPLNTDAIIDKIEIQPEQDGTFKITFNSYS